MSLLVVAWNWMKKLRKSRLLSQKVDDICSTGLNSSLYVDPVFRPGRFLSGTSQILCSMCSNLPPSPFVLWLLKCSLTFSRVPTYILYSKSHQSLVPGKCWASDGNELAPFAYQEALFPHNHFDKLPFRSFFTNKFDSAALISTEAVKIMHELLFLTKLKEKNKFCIFEPKFMKENFWGIIYETRGKGGSDRMDMEGKDWKW